MKMRLTAGEAAAELGVSPATLYAYVSRGMIRSEAQPGTRRKLYAAEDVRALRGRTGTGATASAPVPALDMVETAMTLIHGGRLFYRGVDVEALASGGRLEAVATLLWEADEAVFESPAGFEPVRVASPDAGIIARFLIDLASASERDPAGFARMPEAIARTGARILRQMTATLSGAAVAGVPAHLALAHAWGRPGAQDVVRTALVVLADHELAPSSYAARVTASTGASPWRAVSAGLACLDGPRHGGMAERVATLLDEAEGGDAERVLVRRLRAGEDLPGFGHPLYPQGDPRCRILLRAAEAYAPEAGAVALARTLSVSAARLVGQAPNVDFGLVVACRAAGLPAEAALGLFALARTVGWVGHVIEQSRLDGVIRPRARYVGRLPD